MGVRPDDFARNDLILCMEQAHADQMIAQCPEAHRHKIALIMTFVPQADEKELPDPYFGNAAGFDRVVEMLDMAMPAVLKRIRSALAE